MEKAEGADGKTVAEIFASKASLKDTPVAVRGVVHLDRDFGAGYAYP